MRKLKYYAKGHFFISMKKGLKISNG